MISCKDSECSEEFTNSNQMEVHYSKKHDDSAKEKSICNCCGDLINYYPSSKSGKYCSDCQGDRPWNDGSNIEMDSDLPDKFEQKSYSDNEIKEREFDLSTERRGDVSETEVKREFQRRGVAILEPITDNEPYDLVVETDTSRFYVYK